jgi:hypothetical protein
LVLLDFGHHVAPRIEFPHIRIAYKDHKSKKNEIVSVSLDKKPAKK